MKHEVVSTSNNKGEDGEASNLSFMRVRLTFDVLHEILGLELDVLAISQSLHAFLSCVTEDLKFNYNERTSFALVF